jgi:hypothetical protein
VRLALTAPAQQHDRARLVRLRCLEHAQEVNGWIGNVQEFGCRLLKSARRLVGGKVDGRPFEALSFELLP